MNKKKASPHARDKAKAAVVGLKEAKTLAEQANLKAALLLTYGSRATASQPNAGVNP